MKLCIFCQGRIDRKKNMLSDNINLTFFSYNYFNFCSSIESIDRQILYIHPDSRPVFRIRLDFDRIQPVDKTGSVY